MLANLASYLSFDLLMVSLIILLFAAATLARFFLICPLCIDVAGNQEKKKPRTEC